MTTWKWQFTLAAASATATFISVTMLTLKPWAAAFMALAVFWGLLAVTER